MRARRSWARSCAASRSSGSGRTATRSARSTTSRSRLRSVPVRVPMVEWNAPRRQARDGPPLLRHGADGRADARGLTGRCLGDPGPATGVSAHWRALSMWSASAGRSVIIQELLKRPSRYGELHARLPGIGSSVLADRLRRLEQAGVVARQPGAVGAGVLYALTERGRASMRRCVRCGAGGWASWLTRRRTAWNSRTSTSPMSTASRASPTVIRAGGRWPADQPSLHRRQAEAWRPVPRRAPRSPCAPSSEFLERWAAGDADWDEGRVRGEVTLEGAAESWPRWLAATGYLLRVEPETKTDA